MDCISTCPEVLGQLIIFPIRRNSNRFNDLHHYSGSIQVKVLAPVFRLITNFLRQRHNTFIVSNTLSHIVSLPYFTIFFRECFLFPLLIFFSLVKSPTVRFLQLVLLYFPEKWDPLSFKIRQIIL